MIKILFITPDYYPNSTGFANACTNLTMLVSKYGGGKYEVHVYTEALLGEADELKDLNIIRSSPMRYNKFNRMKKEKDRFKKIKRYCNMKKIDIIFVETNTFPFLQLWLLKEFGNKVFVRIHSTADTEVQVFYSHPTIGSKIAYNRVRKFMYKVSNIVATSEFYLDFIKKYYYGGNVYHIWENKVYSKIYNTVGEGIIKADSVENNTFLTMGKMSENGVVQKGITDLLKGIYLLKEVNAMPEDFKLIIIGDGSCKGLIYKYIEYYGVGNQVEIIPSATHHDVYDYISDAKAVILLSRYEGQSMFITEALAIGKPLILSDGNGMCDMIKDGWNGYLVTTGDVNDICCKLKMATCLDRNQLEKMGSNSRNLYEEKFHPRRVYEQFDQSITMKIR